MRSRGNLCTPFFMHFAKKGISAKNLLFQALALVTDRDDLAG
jgi:hypothetical protein